MATISLTVNSNAAEILRSWTSWPRESQIQIQKNLARELIIVQGDVRRRTGIKSRMGAAGLMGRLTSYARTTDYGLGIDAAIGFRKTRSFPYELAQEFGAKAKPGKAMVIPVSAQARRAGSPRNMAVKLFVPPGTHVLAERPVSSRGIKGLPYHAGPSVVAPLIVHYILIKSIKPRLRFAETVKAAADRLSNAIIQGFHGRAS